MKNLAVINRLIAGCTDCREEEVTPALSLVYDLHMDSLIFTELVYGLEEAFNMVLHDQDVAELFTVSDIYRLIGSRG